MVKKLNIVDVYVLLHLKKAGVDYAKMMAKVTGLPIEKINESVEKLMKEGLIERDEGSAIKRSKARFKKAHEVHKHHTYYRLSRLGELTVRKMDKKWAKNFFEELGLNYREIAKKKVLSDELISVGLISIGFVTKKGKKTKFFEALSYVSGFFDNEKN